MNACEEFVKEHIGKVKGLEEMINKSQNTQEIWGYPVSIFEPLKVVSGSSYVVGVVVRATKQTMALLDARGRLIMLRISKINMIEPLTCEEFERHREAYAIKSVRRKFK